MKKLKLIISIFAVIVIIVFALGVIVAFSIYLANDDDYAPYTHYTKELDVDISGDIFVVSKVKDELLSIIDNENAELCFAYYGFKSLDEGFAEFYFRVKTNKSNNSIAEKLVYDFSKNKITSLTYEEGITKRVSVPGYYDFEHNDLDVREIYNGLLANNELQKSVANIEHKYVIRTYGKIVANVVDSEGNRIYSKEY